MPAPSRATPARGTGPLLCSTAGQRAGVDACRCRSEVRCNKSSPFGYAMGIVAAVAFSVVLYKVVTSGPVSTALRNIVQQALDGRM
ncbi:DUF4244 domain-containing protein [Streptomyces sp. NPDC044984]|uniref:DUF4244 domain-containing protein n=1 Tax=Streptomyces sp. NPDC044984 TaxID=3154335 RepID=UPI0033E7ED72